MINMIKMDLKYKKINMEIYTNMMIKGIELSMIMEKLKDLINKEILSSGESELMQKEGDSDEDLDDILPDHMLVKEKRGK